MTMALAHFQATQRHRAIVWLNVRGELQYRTVGYGHGAQKKLYPDNKGKKVANASIRFQENTGTTHEFGEKMGR